MSSTPPPNLAPALRANARSAGTPVLGEYAAVAAARPNRVKVAPARLARTSDERGIRLHPEALALLAARLPEDWHFEPDPVLERGALRIEGTAGGVEDGPGTWARALSDAISAC